MHIRKLLLFFTSPQPYFLFVLLDVILPSKEGRIFFIRRREYSLIKTERIIAGRGEYFFCGEREIFFSFSWKRKVSVFSPYSQGLWRCAVYDRGDARDQNRLPKKMWRFCEFFVKILWRLKKFLTFCGACGIIFGVLRLWELCVFCEFLRFLLDFFF